MRAYSLGYLSDEDLLSDLEASVTRESSATVEVLARIAEADARRLYLGAGFPSMFAYCVEKLHLSEDAAYKRIQAARAARRFPVLFLMVEEGKIHLTGVCLLAPHLTEENVRELTTAATHKRKLEIEQLLAQRLPRLGLGIDQGTRSLVDPQLAPAQVGTDRQALSPQLAPAQVGTDLQAFSSQLAPAQADTDMQAFSSQLAPAQVGTDMQAFSSQLAPAQVGVPISRAKMTPVAPGYVSLRATLRQSTYEKLQYAQALLSHSLPSGDVDRVMERVLDVFINQEEKRKFAAVSRPRPSRGRATAAKRHIPAHVRRAVWERDQGRCTFESPNGHRCGARKFLEFDHLDPVARGGQATVERMRLRCRAHNQFEAERTFGAEFMKRKREEARRKTSGARARADQDRANATLEERMRAALRFPGPRTARAVTNNGPPIGGQY